MRYGAIATMATLLALTGCGREAAGDSAANGGRGGDDLSGRIETDGSSTVGPFTTAAAEAFGLENVAVQVTVGISGTGGGFERFCRGETDLSSASRPIKDEEAATCEQNGVGYTELQVANDAITIVVNAENDWADCVTVDQLRKLWEPGSKVDSWNDLDAQWPDVKINLFGPGTDSGTFDYFTDEIVGKEGASRSDYQASEDDNVVVTGVSGEEGALGYFGLSYFEANAGRLKALAVDGGQGCVEPSVESAQSGEYAPLSRPLYVYVKNEALARPEVEAFARFMLAESGPIAERAEFVPLTDAERDEQLAKLEDAAP